MGHINFSANFLDFLQFLTTILRKLWRHLAMKIRNLEPLRKGNHFWKRWKQNQNRPINRDTLCTQTMSTSQCNIGRIYSHEQRTGVRNKKKQKNLNTVFSHLQPARIAYFLPNFAWWESSSRLSKKVEIIFRSNTQFFLQVHGKIRPNWPMCSFSAITP